MVSCGNGNSQQGIPNNTKDEHSARNRQEIITGASRIDDYLALLKDKKVGIVGNQSSVILPATPARKKENHVHIVDSLISLGVNITKVFAPEHGFRGAADAGEAIKDGKDAQTGLPVVSLYGNNKKPSAKQLEDIEMMIFDLQDVGARFYTYISSLHYVMEACAENNIPLIIFDRPNPNGHYIDGPVLNPEYQSFVGMHPVPVVHGLTMGEYARMINGEKWLKNAKQCDLRIIEMENYKHSQAYSLPIKPSPNLPNAQSVNLYPSLCFFEGTNVNEGRGTNKQFQVFGSPFLDHTYFDYSYTPESKQGAKNPKHIGRTCYGRNLSQIEKLDHINLEWLIEAYRNTTNQKEFFNDFFIKLAGTPKLQEQIENGFSADEIRETWKPGLAEFQRTRLKYLIYK